MNQVLPSKYYNYFSFRKLMITSIAIILFLWVSALTLSFPERFDIAFYMAGIIIFYCGNKNVSQAPNKEKKTLYQGIKWLLNSTAYSWYAAFIFFAWYAIGHELTTMAGIVGISILIICGIISHIITASLRSFIKIPFICHLGGLLSALILTCTVHASMGLLNFSIPREFFLNNILHVILRFVDVFYDFLDLCIDHLKFCVYMFLINVLLNPFSSPFLVGIILRRFTIGKILIVIGIITWALFIWLFY